ncbi:unnamed protein product [Lasius platythorax]|uniref:Uncharacterized protein n=1 Tax=Lasius platythorax TaxID=488582 RepID=A0AAV2P5J7_9HYME
MQPGKYQQQGLRDSRKNLYGTRDRIYAVFKSTSLQTQSAAPPPDGGVKDLFFLFPPDLNPIRKSAEAFMRSYSALPIVRFVQPGPARPV